MTQEQKRIKIAEACGWTWELRNHPAPCWHKENFYVNAPLFYEPRRKEDYYHDLPDYLNDLDAMHEAEKVLSHDQQRLHMDHMMNEDSVVGDMLRQICYATAAQRAEAFGLTLGLWKEGE